jgi:hypothetical protein
MMHVNLPDGYGTKLTVLTRDDAPGDGPWSRRLRAESRADAVLQAVRVASRAIVDGAGDDEHAWLLYSEGWHSHPRVPGATSPTRRPAWWTAVGLPERRHRASGDAWTAAAQEALFRARPMRPPVRYAGEPPDLGDLPPLPAISRGERGWGRLAGGRVPFRGLGPDPMTPEAAAEDLRAFVAAVCAAIARTVRYKLTFRTSPAEVRDLAAWEARVFPPRAEPAEDVEEVEAGS